MSRFTAIDLSALAAPNVIEEIDYEDILKAMRDDLVAIFPAIAGVIDLESEPARKVLEIAAYREVLVRARVNDAARALLLAEATGADLDHLGALFSTARQEGETDARYRRRIQLAPEAFSVAGPQGAYVYHALTAMDEARDASAIQTAPGVVTVTVLRERQDGDEDDDFEVPSDDQLLAIKAALNTEEVRPLTDSVVVRAPDVSEVTIEAELTLYPGPDASVVRARAEAALAEWVEKNRMLGMNLTRSAIFSRLHQEGVMSVNLVSPAEDVVILPTGVYRIAGMEITTADIRDE